MSKTKVIDRYNIPESLPVNHTLLLVLALNYWEAPTWLCVVTTLYLILLWFFKIHSINNMEQVDLFDEGNADTENPNPETFKERLNRRLDEEKNNNSPKNEQ